MCISPRWSLVLCLHLSVVVTKVFSCRNVAGAFVGIAPPPNCARNNARRGAWAIQFSSTPADDRAGDSGASPPPDNKGEEQQRVQLKQQLLQLSDEFQQMKQDAEKERLAQMQKEEKEAMEEEMSKGYVRKLLYKVMNKIMKRKKKKGGDIVNARTLGTSTVDTGDKGDAIIRIAEQLSKLNPTAVPTYGWKSYGGGKPSDCKLSGTWKLRFTTAADATFPASPKRGKAITSQEIDPKVGAFTNMVDFERGKLKGFRVVVAGEAASDKEIDLTFRRVVILRASRFPRLFGRLILPIPATLFRLVNRFFSRGKSNPRGPYFELQYLDDDFRMHITGDGNWFIQSRLK